MGGEHQPTPRNKANSRLGVLGCRGGCVDPMVNGEVSGWQEFPVLLVWVLQGELMLHRAYLGGADMMKGVHVGGSGVIVRSPCEWVV